MAHLWPMSVTNELLARVSAYCARTGTTERAFGLAMNKNHHLVRRLRAGAVSGRTLNEIAAFMEQYPDGPPPRQNSEAQDAAA